MATPLGMVRAADIAAVVKPIGLDPKAAADLTGKVHRAIRRYRRSKIFLHHSADYGKTLKSLGVIANQTNALAKNLAKLHPELLIALDNNRGDDDPAYDIAELVSVLNRLGAAATYASETIEPRMQGGQPKTVLDETLRQILLALSEAGLDYRAIEAGASQLRKRVDGRGGKLLTQLFDMYDPWVSSAGLYEAIVRIGPSATEPKSS